MTLTRQALLVRGFSGFVPFSDVPGAEIPSTGGIYVVVRTPGPAPAFLATSTAGWRKQRDPAVNVESLAGKWVDGAEIVYIGKADTGAAGGHGLRGRLAQYARHGLGGTSHHGGRYIWQLKAHATLLVGWQCSAQPRNAEKALLAEFEALYGALPFANLKH
ncbi:hypothetical protein [Kitasatospora sp. MAP5-34]|uniref:hypothetical protein n=1 Tax=Kitasatospora sp. MAP5-34 TaxID=3035102 RepID=UPI0024737B96|nr:hypothetical protein [Kitasatospora sp. MAP5-34]